LLQAENIKLSIATIAITDSWLKRRGFIFLKYLQGQKRDLAGKR
jgi:hypothetical protein